MSKSALIFCLLALPNAIFGALGNWSYKDCMLLQFSMNITIYPEPHNPNVTTVFPIPPTATVDTTKSTCGNLTANEDQILTLIWSENQKNDSAKLDREIIIRFRRNLTTSYYGVERFKGQFDLAFWNANGTNYTTAVNVDSKAVPNLLFHTPLDHSFTCRSWGATNLYSYLTIQPDSYNEELKNATVQTSMLKFDAFRTGHKTPTGFRTPMDCLYEPNDIVPIGVGVALAILVVVVLVAYVVGRRRNRARGYESV